MPPTTSLVYPGIDGRLVYISRNCANAIDVETRSIEELVCFDANETLEDFRVSPDGKWVAFTAYFDKYGDDHGCEIYVIRTDGTDLRRLTNNDYCDYQPRWGT